MVSIVKRAELELPKTASGMNSLINRYLKVDGSCAISDDDFSFRKNRTIKALIEEYVPLAAYLTAISVNCTPRAYLTSLGSCADGIVECVMKSEKIQIVQGISSYSEALKREALACCNILNLCKG